MVVVDVNVDDGNVDLGAVEAGTNVDLEVEVEVGWGE